MSKRYQVTLADELAEAVDRLSQVSGVSASRIINDCVDQAMPDVLDSIDALEKQGPSILARARKKK